MKRSLSRPDAFSAALDSLLFCPSCSRWRFPIAQTQLAKLTRRRASTLSSSTAVNASKSIPDHLKQLYTALSDLRRKAPAHVSLSRLHLAQQGLESHLPKIRVAVLGLNVQDTARRIVRLLLADALESKQEWEEQLVRGSLSSGGILIRFGHTPNSNLPQTQSSIPTVHVPAGVLERANVEILVSSISSSSRTGSGNNGYAIPVETFLAPTVGTPTAASGRQTMISQPVHSSLVVARGLDELMNVAELLASTKFLSEEDRTSVRVAMELYDCRLPSQGHIVVVDTQKAEDGLAAIRRSIAEATTFEHKWVESGMPALSTWLSQISDPSGALPVSVRTLISSVLTAASTSVRAYALSDEMLATSRRLSLASRTNLESYIDEFSRNAHAELQFGLASAWSSRNWRKLAWYKLFWRVDDVGLIVNDLISNAWLPRTERAVYELSGRLSQVGISPIDASTSGPELLPVLQQDVAPGPATHPLPVLQAQMSIASQPAEEAMITNPSGFATVTMTPVPQPIPLSASISTTRSAQINRAINELTSTAQQLVLRTLSISGLSAGLSALTYLTLTPGSVYEAGTIAALGTAFALYRMQGSWQRATKDMENSLFDEGRTAIQRIVGRMRELLNLDSQAQGDEVERRHILDALEAVEKAQAEFDRLVGNERKERDREQDSRAADDG